MTDLDALQETRELAMLTHRAAALAGADLMRAAQPLGVTGSMARVLLLLDEPMPMRRIAERLLVDASYVTGVADELESCGIAVRTTGSDRRVKLLAATPAGVEIRARLVKAVTSESTAMQALDAMERAQLRSLLARLVEPPRAEGEARRARPHR
ncbi:MarR family winged helix-turn-helix transcriptional regulator [Agrococcus sp. Marseille-P2731]|uniref:MarR family winged helix-turn-helix transcriptional regulator n=1 Tax=Agrococcus sp. Marseille-P2731 TaxID=1841862 RepID=UPI0009301879|nr:MarR family transcriptional regulator [Agrococcus sp. Marseille-P2731]